MDSQPRTTTAITWCSCDGMTQVLLYKPNISFPHTQPCLLTSPNTLVSVSNTSTPTLRLNGSSRSPCPLLRNPTTPPPHSARPDLHQLLHHIPNPHRQVHLPALRVLRHRSLPVLCRQSAHRGHHKGKGGRKRDILSSC